MNGEGCWIDRNYVVFCFGKWEVKEGCGWIWVGFLRILEGGGKEEEFVSLEG